jgi:purine-binding chemotaxis protein CheW
VPVINLRNFFSYEKSPSGESDKKLVICRTGDRTVALEVDSIVTIYKQEQYQNTSSLNPDLAKKEDVLDRLIVFQGDSERNEHVLVLNIHNMIRNHIDVAAA